MQHRHGNSSNRIAWAFFLNLGFTVIEFIGGVLTNSTAIMADAVHDLGDSISIGSAWILNKLGHKRANNHYTYGYQRLSLLGALINSFVLIVGSAWILITAIPRLNDPVMPVTEGMMLLALLGISVNGYAAYRLSSGETLNERVLNLHLLEDVLGWVAVLLIAITMQFVHWPILDPLLSICFTLFILINVFQNLFKALGLFFQAIPDKALLENIRKAILDTPGIHGLHDVHFWSLDGEHHVLTSHVEADRDVDIEQYAKIKKSLHEKLECFELAHTTIEIELFDETCREKTVNSK